VNWAYPLPWDIAGHLQMFIGGLFWMVVWTVLYIVFVGLRTCWRGLPHIARATVGDTSAQTRPSQF
jgi:hypothetical protein